MTELFLMVAKMSLRASYVIVIVLLVRLLLRRAPKKYSYALWSVVAFRLVCPVTIAMPFSFFSAHTVTEGMTSFSPVDVVEDIVQPVLTETITASLPEPVPGSSIDPIQILEGAIALVWVVGIVLLLAYALVTLVRLRCRLSAAVRLQDNVWQSERISTPFILGIFPPRIIIPFGLEGKALEAVLSHEKFHLKRLDHVVKPVAWLLVVLHWFNPLVWLAFRCMSRDMEMRCDEAVLKDGGDGTVYSTALLSLASGERFPAPGPLAFGESGVSRRVKNALNWKKPRFWVTLVSILLCLAVIVGCGVDPWHNEAETVPTADSITYTGKGGPFVGQHIALSYMPADGSYFARVTLEQGVATIISSDGELLYEGHYDSTESWTRAALLEKLNSSPLWPYGAGHPEETESRWDALVPNYAGRNMERLTFRTPASEDVAWMLYLFNGEPTWLVWGGEYGRYFELVPTE